MLKHLELSGFKSFAKKTGLDFTTPITAVVGPNGSGKSNVAESVRFVLGEQSIKSLRSKKGEDLIFNGSKGSPAQSRARVTITFDNSKRVFKFESDLAPDLNVNFDEITISREVFRDGINKYFLNDTQVRLRDILELLSSVNIGSSGHHIISQGEADRILNASLKERRIMIEESLGLKIYHWKINESLKKLEKTNENVEKAQSLRRELAPHLKFLKKQVEKFERVEELRQKLIALYAEYLRREEDYLLNENKRISTLRGEIEKELKETERTLASLKGVLETGGKDTKRSEAIKNLEETIFRLREEKEKEARVLGRIDATIDFTERELNKRLAHEVADEKSIPLKDVRVALRQIEAITKEADLISDGTQLKDIIKNIGVILREFSSRYESGDTTTLDMGELKSEFGKFKTEREALEKRLREVDEKITRASFDLAGLKSETENDKDSVQEKNRIYYENQAKKSELVANLNVMKAHEEALLREEENFKGELREGEVLIGGEISRYASFQVPSTSGVELRFEQEKRHKEIEKIKIRLEDTGAGGGSDMLKEYRDSEERDQFLAREIEDLEKSATSLSTLIAELRQKLDFQFGEGIEKINTQFKEFFTAMFSGGSASIGMYEEKRKPRVLDPDMPEDYVVVDEEPEQGIEIKVNLPQKKIKDLAMLSGGERALTSIALLFAISQVNPPPFLILDETDAALDEANSRKYGDMLENLSKVSQLVVITHNRETMSRAGILYGVTTGLDAVSRLLSIKFDEALEISK